MRAKGLAAAAALVLGATPVAALAQGAPPKIIRETDPAIWQGNAEGGVLKHLATGVEFPEASGEFRRFRLMAVDDGFDVVVNYRHKREKGDTVVSVFLFKPDVLPEHRLKGSITSFGVGSPDAFLWSDGPFDVPAPAPLRMHKVTFKTGIGPNTVMDYLYFGALGTWTVKVRATLPSAQDIADEIAIDNFVRALPWDRVLAANGACNGAACDTRSPMAFDSHPLEGPLSTMLDMLEKRGDASKMIGATPLHRLESNGVTWTVAALDAKLKGAFTGSFGAVTPADASYALVMRRNGKSAMVRFFSGAPDEALFRKTVQTLERHPESSPFLSAAQVVEYFPD